MTIEDMTQASWGQNRAHYEAIHGSKQWESIAGNTNPFAVATLLDRAGAAGKTVVDIGCGDGHAVARAVALIGQVWHEYVGVDAFAPALKGLCVPSGRGVEIAPLPAGLFSPPVDNSPACKAAMADIALCLFLLQDLTRTDGEKMLNDIAQLVKRSGQLLLGLTVHRDKDGSAHRPSTALEADAPPKHQEFWAINTLRKALAARGFRIEDEIQLPTRHDGHIELYLRATAEVSHQARPQIPCHWADSPPKSQSGHDI